LSKVTYYQQATPRQLPSHGHALTARLAAVPVNNDLSPVPLPISSWLLLSALAGLRFMARSRRSY